MMMPANYSVIAENEMTYVVGGGLFDVLPDVMTSANWKTFNTNLLMLVGNAFATPVVNATLGVMFGGNWGTKIGEDSLFGSEKKDEQGTVTGGNVGSISGYYTGKQTVLNKIMGTIGGLSAIYALGSKAITLTAPTLTLEQFKA